MAIEKYTPYHVDRSRNLAHLGREYAILTDILNNYPDGVHVPYTDSEEDEKTIFITPRFVFGIFLCLRSIYRDLESEGLSETAGDILRVRHLGALIPRSPNG